MRAFAAHNWVWGVGWRFSCWRVAETTQQKLTKEGMTEYKAANYAGRGKRPLTNLVKDEFNAEAHYYAGVARCIREKYKWAVSPQIGVQAILP